MDNAVDEEPNIEMALQSLQVKLNAALVQLGLKDTQVKSLRSDSSSLKKSLAEKTQLYETTITELRSEVQNLNQGNQDIARQLVEKEKESIVLTNQVASLEEQISMKALTISELTANVARREEILRAANADLHQKIAVITQLKVASQERDSILEASRGQVLELQTQTQHKNATIDSFKERVLMLEAKLTSQADETKKVESKNQTLQTQAHNCEHALFESTSRLARHEQTITQLTTELERCHATMGEKESVAANLENASNDASQSLLKMQASFEEKDAEIVAMKSALDARDAIVKAAHDAISKTLHEKEQGVTQQLASQRVQTDMLNAFAEERTKLETDNVGHLEEIDKLTQLLVQKDLEIKRLKSSEMIPEPRKRFRNLVLESDSDDESATTMLNEPPDKLVNDDENPSDFILGW